MLLAVAASASACGLDHVAEDPPGAAAPREGDPELQNFDDYEAASARVLPRWSVTQLAGPWNELTLQGKLELQGELTTAVEVWVVAQDRSGNSDAFLLEALELQPGDPALVEVALEAIGLAGPEAPVDVVLAVRFFAGQDEVEVRSPRLRIEGSEELAQVYPAPRVESLEEALWIASQMPEPEEPEQARSAFGLTQRAEPQAGPFLPVEALVCTAWGVSYDDPDPGQAYLGDAGTIEVPASYAHLVIAEPHDPWPPYYPGAEVWNGYLDASGCAEVMLPQGQYVMTLETLLDRGDARIDVRYDSGAYGYSMGRLYIPNYPGWIVRPTFEDDRAPRVAAIMSRALATDDLPMPPQIDVWADQPCGTAIDGVYAAACGGDGELFIGDNTAGQDFTRVRHVVGHELGHSLQIGAIGGLYLQYGYGDAPVEKATCRCDHVGSSNSLHCLQSRETIEVAVSEGFAHFIAARLFNEPTTSPCRFDYYKEFLLASGVEEGPPYRFDCSLWPRWMENQGCADDDRGTEYDWMSFLYALTRGTAASRWSIQEVLDVIAASDITPGGLIQLDWPSLSEAVDNSGLSDAKKTRFFGNAALFAVDH